MSEYSVSSENGKPSTSTEVVKNGYLGEDGSNTHQTTELSIVEDEEDASSPNRMVNLSGPWLNMPLMGQSAEPSEVPFVERIFKRLYGDIPRAELFRILWLSGTLFFIVGGYWLLRSLKDPIVSTIVGVEYIPKCKIMSLVVIICLTFVYNKLIDMFPKHQLFFILGGFYFLAFTSISVMLADPDIGLSNTNASPTRLIGWISYCAIESFGSICVSLFWAFVNSIMHFDGAKSSYGLIVAGAQVGSILGPTIAAKYASTFGVPLLYGIGGGCMGFMIIMVWGYVALFGPGPIHCEDGSSAQQQQQQDSSQKIKKQKAGVLEGFRLLLTYDYIKGIFALSCLFMIEVTILDYAMKVLAYQKYEKAYPFDQEMATESFTSFMGAFGQITNCVSFAFSLLGTSFVVRHVGLRYTLLAFPTLCACAIIVVMILPRLEVKFKSKSWIDIFGARTSKALGSIITNSFTDSASALIHFGGMVSLAICTFLVYVAWLMGIKFEAYMDIGYHVGERNEDEYFESDDESPLYRGIALQETRETASVEEDDTDGIVEDDQSL